MSGVDRLLAAQQRRMSGIVRRAIVQLVDDSKGTQLLQVAVLGEDDPRDQVEHMQPAGYKSVPLVGSEAVILAAGVDGANSVAAVVHDKAARPKGWEPGDVGLYHLKTGGLLLRLRADGTIQIQAGRAVEIEANVKIKGDLSVTGNVRATGDVYDRIGSMYQVRVTYNGHSHAANGSAPPSPLMPQVV